MRRIVTIGTILALVAVAVAGCGGRGDIYEQPPGGSAADDIALPEPVPAVPAFAVESERDLAPKRIQNLGSLDGVAVAAPVVTTKLEVEGPAGVVTLKVAGVEPLAFRAVAPPATRDAEFVWLGLIGGQAVVTFDASRRLGLDAPGTLDVEGLGSIGVAAFADNGTPNVADVIVDTAVLTSAHDRKPRTVIVGAASGVTLERLAKDLGGIAPGARVRKLGDPGTRERGPEPEQVPASGHEGDGVYTAGGGAIPAMRFEVLKNGFIRPDPAWVRSNIVAGPVPVLGSVTCHKLMFPQLRAAFAELVERGLDDLIRPGDYGGCWVPRFIDRDPGKPLSMHAFGLAFDINVSTNGLGRRGDIDPRIVSVFERWGFTWGGRWSRPDPMHFELARIISM